MKALPGLLIEYLVTGSIVILAAVVINSMCIVAVPGVTAIGNAKLPALALFVPAVYCLGMIVDYLSKGLVKIICWPIKKIWDGLSKKYDYISERKKYVGSYSQAEIMAISDALGSEYVMRSSRDRIARGLFFTVFVTFIMIGWFKGLSCEFIITFLASVLSFCVWWRFDRLSRRWKYSSTEALKNIRANKL